MANNPGATVPKTPLRNSALSSELKSTPHAVGSANISEHISTVGVKVEDVRQWISRDVQTYRECAADTMLQELLERCTDPSQSLPVSEKSRLLKTSLEAALDLCGDEPVAQEINRHLVDFCNTQTEKPSYPPFVRAANCILNAVKKVNVSGIPAFQDDDTTNIVFHVNDPMFMKQQHQGKEANRKPDVVVVSYESAADAIGNKETPSPEDVCKAACKAPKRNFQWPRVRSTLEFKRTKKMTLRHPPSAYNMDYVAPADLYMKYGPDKKPPAEPTRSTAATGPAQTSHDAPNELRPLSELLSSNKDKKRDSAHLHSNDPPTKRSKSNTEKQAEEKDPTKVHPVVQNGLYVAEMFAAHIVRQHVISFIINNDIIYIWYFDREDAIQCSGINFVQDLPRFMVLLLIMQRMNYEQWGLNPVFEPTPGFSGEIMVKDTQGREIDLNLDLKSNERTTHFGLRGRATTVFPVESKALSALPQKPNFDNKSPELVAKLYWPEEERQSEPAILEEVYRIAEQESDVVGHVPEMVWFHKFEGTSTANIRRALGIDDKGLGRRVLCIIVFRKLIPITTLVGDEFLAAWWQAVKCHRALWKRGVRHRDVSPSNLMGYRLDGQFIAVLNDYDLSSFQQDGPRGLERTGTVPFMAIQLLTKTAIQGGVEHLYQHDAESFIWVLTWVCLRYDEGRLLSKDRPLDEWLREDAVGCAAKKTLFLSLLNDATISTSSHNASWAVAKKCLSELGLLYSPFKYRAMADDKAFMLLLKDHV